MNLTRVNAGQDLVISAGDYNSMLDAARFYRGFKKGVVGFGPDVELPYIRCVKSDGVLEYGNAVVITDATDLRTVVDGSSEVLSHINTGNVDVELCDSKDGFKTCGIVVEATTEVDDSGEFAGTKMVTSGLAIARFATGDLNVNHKRAYCGTDGKLVSSNVGQHEILYVLSGDSEGDSDGVTTDKFALIAVNVGVKNTIKARITGATLFDSGNDRRWSYTFEEVKRNSTGNTVVTDGVTDETWSYALNGLEEENSDGATVQSSGYDFSVEPLVSQTGFELQPIRGNPVVTATLSIDETDGTKYADFEMMNIVQGECTGGG